MNNNVTEGMRYPSIDQLTMKTSSKYRLVLAVVERANQIDDTHEIYIEKPVNKKSIGIALEEIQQDKVIID